MGATSSGSAGAVTPRLRTFATGTLAAFKIPRYVTAIEEFPMTASGKVRKVALRQMAVDLLGEQVVAVAALVQTGIDPSYPDDPSEAVKQASHSHFLTSSRVLDMSAFLLLLVGVLVITRVFSAARGGPWAAVARALFTVSAAAGAIATMIVGSLPDVAHAWAGGDTCPQARLHRGVRRARPRQRRSVRSLLDQPGTLRDRVRRRAPPE